MGEQDAHRLRVALAILAHNLRGDGLSSIHPSFALELADFADDARNGTPNERLDRETKKHEFL